MNVQFERAKVSVLENLKNTKGIRKESYLLRKDLNELEKTDMDLIFLALLKKHFVYFCRRKILTGEIIRKDRKFFNAANIHENEDLDTRGWKGFVLLDERNTISKEGHYTLRGTAEAVVFNDVHVKAFGKTHLHMFDRSEVRLRDREVKVKAYDHSKVYAYIIYDDPNVSIYDKAILRTYF